MQFLINSSLITHELHCQRYAEHLSGANNTSASISPVNLTTAYCDPDGACRYMLDMEPVHFTLQEYHSLTSQKLP